MRKISYHYIIFTVFYNLMNITHTNIIYIHVLQVISEIISLQYLYRIFIYLWERYRIFKKISQLHHFYHILLIDEYYIHKYYIYMYYKLYQKPYLYRIFTVSLQYLYRIFIISLRTIPYLYYIFDNDTVSLPYLYRIL